MQPLTVHEAASATGWTARMLRYVEQLGLVTPGRSASGYRLYGPLDLERLRSLRIVLAEHELELGDVAVTLRLRNDERARAAVEQWLDAAPTAPEDPNQASQSSQSLRAMEALRWEQDKHSRLLHTVLPSHTSVKETA